MNRVKNPLLLVLCLLGISSVVYAQEIEPKKLFSLPPEKTLRKSVEIALFMGGSVFYLYKLYLHEIGCYASNLEPTEIAFRAKPIIRYTYRGGWIAFALICLGSAYSAYDELFYTEKREENKSDTRLAT